MAAPIMSVTNHFLLNIFFIIFSFLSIIQNHKTHPK